MHLPVLVRVWCVLRRSTGTSSHRRRRRHVGLTPSPSVAVPASHRWLNRLEPPGTRTASASTTGAAHTTAKGDENKQTNYTYYGDEDGLVVLDPVQNLITSIGTNTLSVGALAVALTGSSVKEVLVHGHTTGPDTRDIASNQAVLVAARSDRGGVRPGTPGRLALLIAGGALT